jgi:hypothetical protein
MTKLISLSLLYVFLSVLVLNIFAWYVKRTFLKIITPSPALLKGHGPSNRHRTRKKYGPWTQAACLPKKSPLENRVISYFRLPKTTIYMDTWSAAYLDLVSGMNVSQVQNLTSPIGLIESWEERAPKTDVST